MDDEKGMSIDSVDEGEKCDICDEIDEVVNFDHGMSESQICEDCLIRIYRKSRGWVLD